MGRRGSALWINPSLLNSTPQLVKHCNEGAHKMERTEQMYTLNMQLDFSKVKVGAAPTPRLTLLSVSEETQARASKRSRGV